MHTDDKISLDPAALIDQEVRGFGSHSFWIGILLMVLGGVGIALPPALAITTVELVSLLLFVGGGFWLWHTARHGGGALRWLKPLVLIVAGVYKGLRHYKETFGPQWRGMYLARPRGRSLQIPMT